MRRPHWLAPRCVGCGYADTKKQKKESLHGTMHSKSFARWVSICVVLHALSRCFPVSFENIICVVKHEQPSNDRVSDADFLNVPPLQLSEEVLWVHSARLDEALVTWTSLP
jgi:hypothetical protein